MPPEGPLCRQCGGGAFVLDAHTPERRLLSGMGLTCGFHVRRPARRETGPLDGSPLFLSCLRLALPTLKPRLPTLDESLDVLFMPHHD